MKLVKNRTNQQRSKRRKTVNGHKKNIYNYFIFTDMKYPGIDRRLILKWIFKKQDGRMETSGWCL
jgi:hypothetical protein